MVDQAEKAPAIGKSTLTQSLPIGEATPAEKPIGWEEPVAGPANQSGIKVHNKDKARDNPSTSRTRIGVAEDLTLTAPDAGGGTWSHSAATGAPTATDAKTYDYRAPAVPGPATVTYTPKIGEAKTVKFDVVKPSRVDFSQSEQVFIGAAGVMMKTKVDIGPYDVSFATVQWREQGGGAASSPVNPEGYFTDYLAKGGDLFHRPNPDWLPIGGGLHDRAGIGNLPKLGDTYKAGKFQWNIPNKYGVDNKEAGDIALVQQKFEMTDLGAVKVEKGAEWAFSGPTQKSTIIGAKTEDKAKFEEELAREGLRMNYERLHCSDDETRKVIWAVMEKRSAMMKVTIRCKKTHSFVFDDDVGSLTINRKPLELNPKKFDKKDEATATIKFTDVMSMNELLKSPGFDIEFVADGKPHKANFSAFTDHEEMSDEYYDIAYKLENPGVVTQPAEWSKDK